MPPANPQRGPVLARDLGSGPYRAFGSALQRDPTAWTPIKAAEPITTRVRRLRSEPPCPTCRNKSAWRCECPCEEDE